MTREQDADEVAPAAPAARSKPRVRREAARGQLRALVALLGEARERWAASLSLRHSFAFWAGLGLLLCLASGLGAGIVRSRADIGLILSLVWWLLTTAALFLGLGLAVSYPARRPLPGLGLPNGLTAVRAYMALPIILFATLPGQFLARDLFLCAAAPVALLDALDGWVARTFGPVSLLGRALDPIMDATFFSLAAVGCLWLGLAPLWLVLLVVVRYALPALGFLILYPWLPRRPEMVATRFGKVNTFAGGVALAGSSLLVLAGMPTLVFDLLLGVVLGVTAAGQVVSLARRTLTA